MNTPSPAALRAADSIFGALHHISLTREQIAECIDAMPDRIASIIDAEFAADRAELIELIEALRDFLMWACIPDNGSKDAVLLRDKARAALAKHCKSTTPMKRKLKVERHAMTQAFEEFCLNAICPRCKATLDTPDVTVAGRTEEWLDGQMADGWGDDPRLWVCNSCIYEVAAEFAAERAELIDVLREYIDAHGSVERLRLVSCGQKVIDAEERMVEASMQARATLAKYSKP